MDKESNVFTALCKAQATMGAVIKGSVNPHYKSKYADLADVMRVVIPAMSAQGIAIHHNIIQVDGTMTMRTMFSHGESDTHVFCDVPLIVAKQDMQGMKSATTYAKRIGVESLSGIAPEDDDGNAAAKAAPVDTGPISEKQLSTITDMIESTDTDQAKFLEFMKVDSLNNIPASDYGRAMNALRAKQKKAAS